MHGGRARVTISRVENETDFQAGAAQKGDETAFSVLYARLAPALYAWARFRIHGPMQRHLQAEDVLQEVWWRALDGFSRFDAERGAFRAWIFGIANNVLRDALRRRPTPNAGQREVDSLSPELEGQLTSIATGLGREERVVHLIDAIADLPREDQKLVVQCGLEGLMLKEVAPQLGLSEDAAKRRWQRLRQRLRAEPAWVTVVECLES